MCIADENEAQKAEKLSAESGGKRVSLKSLQDVLTNARKTKYKISFAEKQSFEYEACAVYRKIDRFINF